MRNEIIESIVGIAITYTLLVVICIAAIFYVRRLHQSWIGKGITGLLLVFTIIIIGFECYLISIL